MSEERMVNMAPSFNPDAPVANHNLEIDPEHYWPRVNDYSGGPSSRIEVELLDVVVTGKIPKQISGTFYRAGADPVYAPTYYKNGKGFISVDGDGFVSALRIKDGRADLKQRFVATEKLRLERAAGRSLFGLYRNPFTDHPCVREAISSNANTHILLHAGKLIVMSERAQPYQLDPNTLETVGYNPFKHTSGSSAFSAHCKQDPFTGELVTWGYEAKGLATRDVCVWSIDREGQRSEEIWFKQPKDEVRSIHDGGASQNWVVLFGWPSTANLDRMKAGGHHFQWNSELGARIYLIPRRGTDTTKIKSFVWPVNSMSAHVGAVFERNGKVYADSTYAWDPSDERALLLAAGHTDQISIFKIRSEYVRWELDPHAADGSEVGAPEVLHKEMCEWPKVDERFQTKAPRYSYLGSHTPGTIPLSKAAYEGLNSVVRIDHDSNNSLHYCPGARVKVGEPVFIERHAEAAEGDGFTLFACDVLDEFRTEFQILDSRDWSKPVAILKLPFRSRGLIHGSWVPEDIVPGGYKSIITSMPPVETISKEGPWDFTRDCPRSASPAKD